MCISVLYRNGIFGYICSSLNLGRSEFVRWLEEGSLKLGKILDQEFKLCGFWDLDLKSVNLIFSYDGILITSASMMDRVF
jgi:hypothetical protein